MMKRFLLLAAMVLALPGLEAASAAVPKPKLRPAAPLAGSEPAPAAPVPRPRPAPGTGEPVAPPLALSVLSFTFMKTLLYFLCDWATNWSQSAHNDAQTWWLSVFRDRVVWQRSGPAALESFEFVAAHWTQLPQVSRGASRPRPRAVRRKSP